MRPKIPRYRKFIYVTVLIALAYGLAETAASTYNWFQNPSWEMFADRHCGVSFCPIRGMKFPLEANRKLTYRGTELVLCTDDHGNNEGFPDQEFQPEKDSKTEFRFLILGDSFSAGTYIDVNWPARVEEHFRTQDRSIELLNFSQGGIGLANWWSIVTKLIEPSHYDFDAVVFAVFGNDLRRNFYFGDGVSYAYANSWKPAEWPKTAADAEKLVTPIATTLSTEDFERVAEQGPTLRDMPFRPVLSQAMQRCLRRLDPRKLRYSASREKGFDERRAPLVADLRQFVRRRNVPAIVVFIPTKDRALGEREETTYRTETELFAQQLGAVFIDGAEIFRGMEPEQVWQYWFKHDPHWNQAGSDLFAHFMVDRLSTFCTPRMATRAK